MPQPAHTPPGAGGESAAGIVVDNNLVSIVDAESSETSSKIAFFRQRMAPASSCRGGEVVVKTEVMRGGNMPFPVGTPTKISLTQARATVEYLYIRYTGFDECGERSRADQGSEVGDGG